MSQADIDRFTRDLQSNEALRDEVRGGASGVASIVEIAKRHGYDVTVDEVKSHIRGRASQDLSDQQLEALAGGAGAPRQGGDPPPVITVLDYSQTQLATQVVAVTITNTNTTTLQVVSAVVD